MHLHWPFGHESLTMSILDDTPFNQDIADTALDAFKEHVKPELGTAINLVWVMSAFSICIGWLCKIKGEDFTRQTFEEILEMYLDRQKQKAH